MPTRDDPGFTSQDRELLITLKIELTHIRDDVRGGITRIALLEADRVTQHDYESALSDIDDLRAAHIKDEARISELEKLAPIVARLNRQIWVACGAVGALFFVARLLFKI